MKTIVGIALGVLVAATMLVSGLIVGAPIATAQCVQADILPAPDGTYSLCSSGLWIPIDRQLCVDYPNYTPHCTQTTAPATTSAVAPAPAAPPPPVAPPPVPVPPIVTPYVPYIPAPSVNVPAGCTWVDGYTRSDGTRVRGHVRC